MLVRRMNNMLHQAWRDDTRGIFYFTTYKRWKLLDQESRQKITTTVQWWRKRIGRYYPGQVLYTGFKLDVVSQWIWQGGFILGLVSGSRWSWQFSLNEFQETQGPLGLPIEQDLYFKPLTLWKLMEIHQNEKEDWGEMYFIVGYSLIIGSGSDVASTYDGTIK